MKGRGHPPRFCATIVPTTSAVGVTVPPPAARMVAGTQGGAPNSVTPTGRPFEARTSRCGWRWPLVLLLPCVAVVLLWAIWSIWSVVPRPGGVERITGASVTAGADTREPDGVFEVKRGIPMTPMTPTGVFAPNPEPVAAFPTHPIVEPTRIVIPSLGVNADLVPVGLLDDGAMEIPAFGLAGWYRLGPAPGAVGPAVIVAHLDTKHGPDVFYRLRELLPGDGIEVHGAGGEVAVFTVESQEEVLKRELPTERIWNQTTQAALRLITCAGEFDTAGGHYLSNTIVYAHLEAS